MEAAASRAQYLVTPTLVTLHKSEPCRPDQGGVGQIRGVVARNWHGVVQIQWVSTKFGVLPTARVALWAKFGAASAKFGPCRLTSGGCRPNLGRVEPKEDRFGKHRRVFDKQYCEVGQIGCGFDQIWAAQVPTNRYLLIARRKRSFSRQVSPKLGHLRATRRARRGTPGPRRHQHIQQCKTLDFSTRPLSDLPATNPHNRTWATLLEIGQHLLEKLAKIRSDRPTDRPSAKLTVPPPPICPTARQSRPTAQPPNHGPSQSVALLSTVSECFGQTPENGRRTDTLLRKGISLLGFGQKLTELEWRTGTKQNAPK